MMKMQDVIINVPLVGVKSRCESMPVLRDKNGEIAHCFVVRIPIKNKAKIKRAKKEGDAFVQGSKGLRKWFERINREYKIVG